MQWEACTEIEIFHVKLIYVANMLHFIKRIKNFSQATKFAQYSDLAQMIFRPSLAKDIR